jgi:hypothetical protein
MFYSCDIDTGVVAETLLGEWSRPQLCLNSRMGKKLIAKSNKVHIYFHAKEYNMIS